MATEIIGSCRCPVCSSPKASLRLSAKQLAYVHCNACHFQGFARSDHSDSRLRALLIASHPEPAAVVPEPTSSSSVPAPPPPPAATKPGWGIRSW